MLPLVILPSLYHILLPTNMLLLSRTPTALPGLEKITDAHTAAWDGKGSVESALRERQR